MKNGECPKCGSHEVYASTTGPGVCPEHWRWNVATANGATTSVDDQTLLCAACGYWESYLRNSEAIADIVAHAGGNNWVKVSPAGWFADPASRHELRYWDGTMWTASVSDSGTVSDDPIRPKPGPFVSGD